MDGSNTYETDDVVLQRIGRTLMALATLCDRAAFLPRPIRFLILWIMRPTEARVRTFLVGWAEDLGAWAGYPENYFFHNGDSRADALHMALRFEALAALLEDLMQYEATIDGQDRHYWPGWLDGAAEHFHMRLAPGFERLQAAHNTLTPQLQTLPRWAFPAPDT